MKTYNIILISIYLAVLVGCVVPIPNEEDCLIVSGSVTHIYEGGVKDVCFRLDGSTKMFYINRGLEQGLDLQHLRHMLLGEEVTIKYPDYLGFLGDYKSTIHLSKLEWGTETIYTELRG